MVGVAGGVGFGVFVGVEEEEEVYNVVWERKTRKKNMMVVEWKRKKKRYMWVIEHWV